MTAEELRARVAELMQCLALDAGERIFCIDEHRALHAARKPTEAATAHGVRAPTSIAIIPLMGSLSPRGSSGMEGFRDRLSAALANPDVGSIVLDVDTPGGTYAGTPETGAAVAAAAQVKPVTAVVDSLCASAGYFIAAQPGVQIVATPSSDVGSIGVLSVHMDVSKLLEQWGITPTVIRSTPFKAEGNGLEPLTDEAKANIQAEVDDAHQTFIRSVAAGRRTSLTNVRDNFGQGRTVAAAKALQLGMVDRIGTMADVLGGARTKHTFKRRASVF